MPLKKITTSATTNTRARVKSTTAPPAKKAVSAKPANKANGNTKTARKPAQPSTAKPVVKDTPKPSAARRAAPAASEPDVVVHLPIAERAAQINLSRRIGGLTYKQIAEVTGYSPGSEGFTAVIEVLRGGETRQEINHRVAALLPPQTKNGTPKMVSNLVSSVIRRMTQQGFTVTGTWKMVKPAGM